MSSSSTKEEHSQNTEDLASTTKKADLFAASAAEHALPSTSKVSEAIPPSNHSNDDEPTPKSSKQLSNSTSGSPVSLKEGVESGSELGGVNGEENKDLGTEPTQAPPQTKEELVEEALNCPCVASMKEGPCGVDFIAAYRCFLESETEPKGMDCMDQFKSMQACIGEHPDEYNLDDDSEDSDPFAHAPHDDIPNTQKSATSNVSPPNSKRE